MKRPLGTIVTSAKKRRLLASPIVNGVQTPILAWLADRCDDRFRALALTSRQWLEHAAPLRRGYLCTITHQNHKTIEVTNHTYVDFIICIELDNHKTRTTARIPLAPNESIKRILTISPQGHKITVSFSFRYCTDYWSRATIEFLRYGPEEARFTLNCSLRGKIWRTLVTNGHTRVD